MNTTIIIVIAVAGLWALSLFFGYIGSLSKNFSHTPTSSINATAVKAKEQQTIEDTEAKREKMMDDIKQKIEDGSKQY